MSNIQNKDQQQFQDKNKDQQQFKDKDQQQFKDKNQQDLSKDQQQFKDKNQQDLNKDQQQFKDKNQQDLNKDQQKTLNKQQFPQFNKQFNCSIKYSSSSVFKDGAQNIEEHLKLKYPEMEVTADRIPGKDDFFDVDIKRKDGTHVLSHKIKADELENQVNEVMSDMTKRIDQEFKRFDQEFGSFGAFPSLGSGGQFKALGENF